MEQPISDCIIKISDEELDYIDSWFEENPNGASWFEENPNGASKNFPEWIWDDEEMPF